MMMMLIRVKMGNVGGGIVLSAVVVIMMMMVVSGARGDLDYDYYDKTCEEFEGIVSRKMKEWQRKDSSILPSILRLHYHDCAVRGCDGSILLDYPGSERTSAGSKSLRGFEVIEDIKTAVEKACPRTVSCADILTAAARDAVVLLKGPFWANYYGRKDGVRSYAQEADKMPGGHHNVTYLIEFYQSIGLDVLDLVVLSGAHTIGRTSCESINHHHQLYYHYSHNNKYYHGDGDGDDDQDKNVRKYHSYLRRKCRMHNTTYVDLDATTPDTFDGAYYTNLLKKIGTLYTDQILETDPRTTRLVHSIADEPSLFTYMFSDAMVRLGNILAADDDDDHLQGEVRLTCSRRLNDNY